MNKKTLFAALTAAALLGACGKKEVHSEEEHGHAEPGASTEEVHLVKKQMDVMGITLGTFKPLNLSTTVKSSGQLELPPQNKASVSAMVGGKVKTVAVVEGDYVKKGQALALLEDPEFLKVQEVYLAAQSQFSLAEKKYAREKALHDNQVTSTSSFEEAETEFQVLRSAFKGAKAKLDLLGIDAEALARGEILPAVALRSPINGYVRHIEVNTGKYVSPEQELFEVIDNEHIHIDLLVYEKDIDKVKQGQKVVFSLATRPDTVFEGKIFAVGKAFEQSPRALLVHADIDNRAGNLLPGMTVDARIVTDEKKVMALPDEALVSDGGLRYIFVLTAGGSDGAPAEAGHARTGADHPHEGQEEHGGEFVFRKIEVNVGASDMGFSEAIPVDSLPGEASIVIEGAYYLLAEMKKGEGGEEHHH